MTEDNDNTLEKMMQKRRNIWIKNSDDESHLWWYIAALLMALSAVTVATRGVAMWEKYPVAFSILSILSLLLLWWIVRNVLRVRRLRMAKNKIMKANQMWTSAEVQGKQVPEKAATLLQEAHSTEIKYGNRIDGFYTATARFLENQGNVDAANYCYRLAVEGRHGMGFRIRKLLNMILGDVVARGSLEFSFEVDVDFVRSQFTLRIDHYLNGQWHTRDYLPRRLAELLFMYSKCVSGIGLSKTNKEQHGLWAHCFSEDFTIDIDVSAFPCTAHTPERMTFVRRLPTCTLKGKELKAEAKRLGISSASKMKADGLRCAISLAIETEKWQAEQAKIDASQDDTVDIDTGSLI